jgi:hypothetical protein
MRAAQMSGGPGGQGNPSELLLMSMSRQNFMSVFNALVNLEFYWSGVNDESTFLEKRTLSVAVLDQRLTVVGSGLTGVRRATRLKTFISLPDTGLLQRFKADPNHPNNVAPATDTSLRDSVNKNSLMGSGQFWLSDLMTGYIVEDMSFSPTESFDLIRLLGTQEGFQDLSGGRGINHNASPNVATSFGGAASAESMGNVPGDTRASNQQ